MSFTYRLICPACRKNTPVKTWTVPEIITPLQYVHQPDKSYHILQIQENRGEYGFPKIGATDVVPDEFYMDIVEFFKHYHGEMVTAIDVLDKNNPDLAVLLETPGRLVTVELPSGEKIIAPSENVQAILDECQLRESVRGEMIDKFKTQYAEQRKSKSEKYRASLGERERMAYDMMMFFRKTLRAKMPTAFLEDGGTIFFFKARTKTIVFECETDMFYSLMEKFAAEPIRV